LLTQVKRCCRSRVESARLVRIRSIEEVGLETLGSDADRMFFRDFEAFGEALNQGREWRSLQLQEQPNRIKRNYTIYYNALDVGRLEIWADNGYTTEVPEVHADIDFRYLQFLPWEEISAFLFVLRRFLCTDAQISGQLEKVDRALLAFLWETTRMPSVLHRFYVGIWGRALFYIGRTSGRGAPHPHPLPKARN
jgi:hypothetical protein